MKTNPLFLTRHLDGTTFRYKPQHGIDGGFLSEWEPLYEASTVKADADKLKAFQSGVPVGSKYEPTGTKSWAPVFENANLATDHQQLMMVTATEEGFVEEIVEEVNFVPMVSGVSR